MMMCNTQTDESYWDALNKLLNVYLASGFKKQVGKLEIKILHGKQSMQYAKIQKLQ